MCVHIRVYSNRVWCMNAFFTPLPPNKELVLKFEKRKAKIGKGKTKVSPGPLECPPEHGPEDEREVVVGGRDEEQCRADMVVDE